jgi:hypothetical protein
MSSERASFVVDESACNPKPKSLRQPGRTPFNLGHNDLANDRTLLFGRQGSFDSPSSLRSYGAG